MKMSVCGATKGEVIDAINCAVESVMMDAKGGAISWKEAERKLEAYLQFSDAAGYERLTEYVAERYLLANVEATYERESVRLLNHRIDTVQ